MAQLFNAGETKIRPGVYYRYSTQSTPSTGAMDGINAIVIRASWGPTGTVTAHETASSISEAYGAGDGVDAALMLLSAGASKVYIYRPEGSGGVKGTASVGGGTMSAKYYGARALTVKIQAKPGDATKKECVILDGTTQLEKFGFTSAEGADCSALKAVLANSKYVEFTYETDATIEEGEFPLEGGADPTITAQDYLKGFQALEPYRYNVLSTDSVDKDVAAIVQSYADEAEKTGKLVIAVIGDTASDFETRKANALACNDKKIVYFGSGFVNAEGEIVDGAKAINYAAGAIASTPSNQSIVRTIVSGATDTTEKLTNLQYEEAITSGLLLLSIGPDGQIWFDSGINTLATLADNEDAGWKKIKRTKVRFELFDRIDRVTSPLVGKVNCDDDGIAAIIQAGMGVITSMIAEKKIMPGATMIEDPENPHAGDSAWFIIQVDDIDSLEKIYLHYLFRYSQNA